MPTIDAIYMLEAVKEARKAFEAGFETSRVVREIRRIYEEMITE